MKISENTMNIFKNFALINPSIAIKPGNVIQTISPQRTIFATAVVEEEFPSKFAIYELNKFTGAVGLFNNPDFEFYDEYVKINEGKHSIRYIFADESMIVTPPEKKIKMPSIDVEFDLTTADLSKLLKAISVLHLPEMSIVGDDGTIYIKAINNKNPSNDSFSIAVGVTNKKFNLIIKAEHLKLMQRDYKVSLSSKGITEFNHNDKLSYWIATEANSKFE